MRIAKCEKCGAEFETNIRNKKFCSGECYNAAQVKRMTERRRRIKGIVVTEDSYKRVCLTCGKEFTVKKSSVAEFCSKECRKAWSSNPVIKRKRTYDSLAEADRKAKELGISYGKMKAMEYVEQMKLKGENYECKNQ